MRSPSTPGMGFSREAYTEVTNSSSQPWKAAANSRWSWEVRLYRCGWNTATRREAPIPRAALRVAATSVG